MGYTLTLTKTQLPVQLLQSHPEDRDGVAKQQSTSPAIAAAVLKHVAAADQLR